MIAALRVMECLQIVNTMNLAVGKNVRKVVLNDEALFQKDEAVADLCVDLKNNVQQE